MSAETEIKDNVQKSSESIRRPFLSIYIVLLLCAFLFIITCQGGILAAVRGIVLGGCILLGVFLVKRFYEEGVSWKKRVGYSMLFGILSGLFAAIIIWALELKIGSPTLSNNPYTQNAENLFWICPLYGLFMLGSFLLTLKLPWILRFIIVWICAALVSTFGLQELASSPELNTYILGLLKGCYYYYPKGLVNCFMFVLLWTWCASVIWRGKHVNKTSIKKKVINVCIFILSCIALGFIHVYFHLNFEASSIDIANERFCVRHKNTVFSEKMTGIIVLPRMREYYDCEKQEFRKLPVDIKISDDFEFNLINDSLEKERYKNSKLIKIIILKERCWAPLVINDKIYYAIGGRYNYSIARLAPPNYDKVELVVGKLRESYFYISPDEKFIIYYDGGNKYRSNVLCIMNLKSKKVLALKNNKGFSRKIYWVKSIEEFKRRWQLKKQKVKKHVSVGDLFGE